MRRIKKGLFLLLLFCSFRTILFAQNKKIDSLFSVLKTAKEDTTRINTLIHISSQFAILRKNPEIKKYAEEALSIVTENESKGLISKTILKGKANAYMYIGRFYYHTGNYQQALKNYQTAQKIYEDIGNKRGIAVIYLNRGNVYLGQNNQTEALKNFETTLKIAEEIKDTSMILGCYSNIGVVYDRQSNYPEALKIHLAALKLREESGDKAGVAQSYNNIGSVYGNQRNYKDALKNFQVALKIYEEIGDKYGIADFYNNVGFIYFNQGNIAEAIKNYFFALKTYEKIGDKSRTAIVYANIAPLYFNQNNYPEALKNHQAAAKLWEEMGNKKRFADSHGNIGIIYVKQGDYSKALENFQLSLSLYQEVSDKQGIARIHANFADIYFQQGNYAESLKSYLLAIKLSTEIDDKVGLAAGYGNVAEVYMIFKKYTEADEYLQKSMTLAKEIRYVTFIKNNYQAKAKLDSATGNYKGAYENHKLYILHRDSLVNEENTKKILQAQMQYDFDKKEDSLKFMQAVTDEQLKRQTLLAQQQYQSILLNEKELALLNKEKEIQHLAYLQTQSDLEIEQAKRTENEKQLMITSQEKKLQQIRLDLQASQLSLQEKDLQAKKTQRNILIAGTFVLLLLSFFIYRNSQNHLKLNKLYRVSAEKQMAELQLQSLRAQLNPHFMFNSLNAIQELIVMEENEKSQSYLERFAQLLRQLLDNANQPFIPLRKEINFLELYLSLESLRLPDLKYSITIDPELKAENITIPNMMLQPYIENALWHGLQHKQGEKKLKLHISRQNGAVRYTIMDNGVGRKKAEEMKSLYRKEHRSKGMELLSQRFDLLSQEYGQNITTTITDLTENGDAAGTLVEITVPASLSEKLFKSEETER